MAKKKLKERMKKKREQLRNRGSSGAIHFLKDGETLRARILSMGEEEEFIQEVVQFYLGSDIKGVISPVTIDEPCAIYETFQELKESDEEDDRELSTKFIPKKKYLALCILYKDNKGKIVDEENSPKFVMLTSGMYEEVLDLFLDEDEWGDMTDPEDGYDVRFKREGSGMKDTTYTVTPCSRTPFPEEYEGKTFDMKKELKKIIPSYEKTEEYRDQFLGLTFDDTEEEEETPKKKTTRKKRRKKKSDI